MTILKTVQNRTKKSEYSRATDLRKSSPKVCRVWSTLKVTQTLTRFPNIIDRATTGFPFESFDSADLKYRNSIIRFKAW